MFWVSEIILIIANNKFDGDPTLQLATTLFDPLLVILVSELADPGKNLKKYKKLLLKTNY